MISVSLRDISLDIGGNPILMNINTELCGPGCVVLFGPNGAGKSTLLKAITGMIQPQKGDVVINGFNIRNNREKVLELIGAHIEPGTFYPQLTGREILNFMEKMRPKLEGNSYLDSSSIIDRLGMRLFADKKISTYSTGMRRKLSVAAAAICSPPVIILDEPTDGLDPASSRQVNELIRYLHMEMGRLIIMTSHDLEGAEAISTRKLILIDGKIVFDSDSTQSVINLKIKVSNPQDLDNKILIGKDFVLKGQLLVIRNLEKIEVNRIIRDVASCTDVDSISLQSDFREYYESYLENDQKKVSEFKNKEQWSP